MKKYLSIIAVAAVAAYATSALAQGTVGFNNASTSLINQWTDATGSATMAVPKGAGFVQLAFAPGGTAFVPYTVGQTASAWIAANPGWTLGSSTPINPVAGRFNGGIVTLTGVAAGANADYVILGWTGTQASYDAALAEGAFVNVSGRFTTPTGGVDPLVPPPQLAGTFTGLTLQVIPEPSAFALAGLGAAAMLIFRRRK
jgi:PEP-CTERM motif